MSPISLRLKLSPPAPRGGDHGSGGSVDGASVEDGQAMGRLDVSMIRQLFLCPDRVVG